MLKLKLQYLATSCKELTHWKRPWCWEGLGAGGEGDDRGWDGWMISLTQWMWVWVNSGSWWWTGRPGMLQFMGSQGVGHDWITELNWCRVKRLKSKTMVRNVSRLEQVLLCIVDHHLSASGGWISCNETYSALFPRDIYLLYSKLIASQNDGKHWQTNFGL